MTLTITGGSTTLGDQACIFAGGYATLGKNVTEASGVVYTVAGVTATISGGSWGEAAGGRGVFGGIFASSVTAQVIGNVNLTISGGSMGNVYGGGWAQKGGASIVGNVNLTISGGTMENVFGGGSTSTSGGSTVANNVTITVSGGTITGNIFARGQSQYDAVMGSAEVIFKGAANFGCNVWGYSYVGGAGEGATLSFGDYTGTISGRIGGFDGITLDGGTAMTFAAAADVSNGAWEFDLTGRSDMLAETSLLTWDGAANFENDTVRVTFADAAQAAAGWNIATAAFDATTSFTLAIDDTDIATVAYDTAISGGDWNGWKFTDVDGVLKFAKITA